MTSLEECMQEACNATAILYGNPDNLDNLTSEFIFAPPIF